MVEVYTHHRSLAGVVHGGLAEDTFVVANVGTHPCGSCVEGVGQYGFFPRLQSNEGSPEPLVLEQSRVRVCIRNLGSKGDTYS